MADRTVNVRLNLDSAGVRRGSTAAQQDFRQVGTSAQQAGARIGAAFGEAATEQAAAASRAAAAQQAAFERAARAAVAAGRATAEASTQAAVATERIPMAAADIPPAFRAASTAATRSVTEIGAAAGRSTAAIVQASAAATSATSAATAGTERLSAASRIALAQAAAGAGVVTAEAAAAQATMLGRARTAVTEWGASMRAQAVAASAAMVASAERSEAAWKALRTTGVALLAVFAAAVVASARFEQSMSTVAAASGATGKELEALRKTALEAGKATVFSAREAADAEVELARAGVSTADIVGGALRGALDLAASGQLSLGESAVIAAQAMNAFNLRGAQVGHIADVISAGAGKSATNVHDMGFAFKMSALVAQQTGLTLEDTVGTLALFAQNALTGSDAGTSLKVMLQRLTPQSAESSRMMQQLGFSAYDAQGKFVGIEELARRMAKAFGDLTPEARNAAMGVIFGADAVRSASILYKAGEQQVRGWIGAVNDEGYATRTAAQQTDNLVGDLERLKGSLETALIESGSSANAVLRDMVKWVTSAVDAYSSLPGPVKTTVTAVAGISGVIAVAIGGFVLALPKIAAFRTAMVELAVTMPRLAAAASFTTSTLLGPWGIAIGGAVAAMMLFSGSHKTAKVDVEGLTAAVKQDSGIIGQNTQAYAVNELQKSGAMAAAKALGVNLRDLTAAALGNTTAIKAVHDQMQAYAATLGKGGMRLEDFKNNVVKVDSAIDTTKQAVADATEAVKLEGEATGKAAVGTKTLGDAAEGAASDLTKAKTAAEQLTFALSSLNGVNISVASSAISFQGDLQTLRDTVKENGHELDITTEKGRAVKTAVLSAADAAIAHAKAVAEQTGSVEAGTVAFGRDVEALRATMRQAGFTAEQIEQLTSAYAQLPPTKETKITDPGAQATLHDLEDLREKLAAVPPGKSITVRAPTDDAIQDLKTIGYAVERLPDGRVKVTVPTNDAFSGANQIQQAINGIRGRTVTVSLQYAAGLHRAGDLPSEQADGSVIRYANGGIRAAAEGLSTRQAGIATRPILWAEAGPEAYIPLDPAKRRRSMGLLGEVAGIFGQQLIPARPVASELIPARQIAGPAGGASYDHSRATTIHLYGARQSSDEQLADLARRLEFIT
ncbi:phage tail tape measure protein [Kitasatospora sp. A2-31]|uniref:phage tail tape measure protein n=1 Tax=Kitasatospora sp. A2-31 TaxID=2916414 RepID=UPI001EED6261|nr:phage tail tape measure protein [Kitasatospora sp. A2-31]MCG6499467.1 phage tail tape measure protein [Kitasatospora sp. A2-31]